MTVAGGALIGHERLWSDRPLSDIPLAHAHEENWPQANGYLLCDLTRAKWGLRGKAPQGRCVRD
jgi:hypothetical protein